MAVGADTGGTFTDLVDARGRGLKIPSTPADPATAVAHGMDALAERPSDLLAHGTTVATNALLERTGAKVALVTNSGFADLIEIGRQNRPSLYDQWADRPPPLVARSLRHEVAGRLDASGNELEPVLPGAVPSIDPSVEEVAVCLLHADLNSAHEILVGRQLAERGFSTWLSSSVSPEFREFERAVTTVIHAYLGPLCRDYLFGLRRLADQVVVMSSAGGLVGLEAAAAKPASLLLSGPAAGVRAAAAAAAAEGFSECVSLDMGGTSTDVCLIRGQVPEMAAERQAAGFPLRVPALDVQTIGAGGGSIARLDPGGALAVGPRSAGAVPGPACYGRQDTLPTVTDADLLAGRIPNGMELPGIGVLDAAASKRAFEATGLDPTGVISVVNASMVRAIRAVTVERGVDPRSLVLVAFGGAGPLHACALADELGMPAVLVPPRAGVLSAVGLLCAPRQLDLVRSWARPGCRHGLDEGQADLAEEARAGLEASTGPGTTVKVETFLDCRYRGQSHELNRNHPRFSGGAPSSQRLCQGRERDRGGGYTS